MLQTVLTNFLFFYPVIGLTIIINATSTNGGLRWLQVTVPQFRMPGESAILQCDYDLGNDTLYAVKWYKEHEELYRFVPKARPQAISYSVEGAQVDMSKSNSRKVVLYPISWKTSGLYRCEVSAEAPSFTSAQGEARMEVVAFAQEDPVISGVMLQYDIGDQVALNCTSGKSHPASILHWYINEKPVTDEEVLIKYPLVYHRRGLVTSILGLQFFLSNNHFHKGSMRIRCVASVWSALARKDRDSEIQDFPIKDQREALLLIQSSTSRSCFRASFLLIVFVFEVIVSTSF